MARRKWHRQRFCEKAYLQQLGNAERRGIEFLLTYEEWLQIWQDSGYLAKRGRKSFQYCMGRYGDKGPYQVGNVYILTCLENLAIQKRAKHTAKFKADLAERNRTRIWTEEDRADMGKIVSTRTCSDTTRAKRSKSGKLAWKEGRYANRKPRKRGYKRRPRIIEPPKS